MHPHFSQLLLSLLYLWQNNFFGQWLLYQWDYNYGKKSSASSNTKGKEKKHRITECTASSNLWPVICSAFWFRLSQRQLGGFWCQLSRENRRSSFLEDHHITKIVIIIAAVVCTWSRLSWWWRRRQHPPSLAASKFPVMQSWELLWIGTSRFISIVARHWNVLLFQACSQRKNNERKLRGNWMINKAQQQPYLITMRFPESWFTRCKSNVRKRQKWKWGGESSDELGFSVYKLLLQDCRHSMAVQFLEDKRHTL